MQTIQALQPDVVLLELCRGRLSILELDEETLLQEAKNFNVAKLKQSISQVHFQHFQQKKETNFPYKMVHKLYWIISEEDIAFWNS